MPGCLSPNEHAGERWGLRQERPGHPGQGSAPASRVVERTAAKRGGGRKIACDACGGLITSTAARIAVGGSHEHHFFNPHGFLFHIGCFSDAPGCHVTGTPTFEFTWFPGHAWRYASCAQCGLHLGWRFDSASGSGFFGLILDRLREVEEEQGRAH